MARILIKTESVLNRTLELRLGANRIGRVRERNDFSIPHESISALHCEMVMTGEGVYLRDCQSTNGTFLNEVPVKEPVWLVPGQNIRLGDVEMVVESTDIVIALPDYDRTPEPAVKPPVFLEDGSLGCPRHPGTAAVFRCPKCGEIMCQSCVRTMKRQGGAPLFLCRLCSHKCEDIMVTKAAKKRGFLDLLQDTVKLKFGFSKDQPKK